MSYITVDLIENEVRQVHTNTVGQFTGLTDKNGQRIFEGDIVTVNDGYNTLQFTGYVTHKDASYCIVEQGIGSHYRWVDYECAVIGNAFDNPNLLSEDAT